MKGDGMGWDGHGIGRGTWCGHQRNGIGEEVSPRGIEGLETNDSPGDEEMDVGIATSQFDRCGAPPSPFLSSRCKDYRHPHFYSETIESSSKPFPRKLDVLLTKPHCEAASGSGEFEQNRSKPCSRTTIWETAIAKPWRRPSTHPTRVSDCLSCAESLRNGESRCR